MTALTYIDNNSTLQLESMEPGGLVKCNVIIGGQQDVTVWGGRG